MYKIKLVTGCVFLLAATYADAAKYISVSVTQTQTGPDIYITGTNFKPNTTVTITYKNLPLFAPNVRTKSGAIGRTDRSGAFFIKDTEWELNLIAYCTNEQCLRTVTVYATEIHKGKKYWSIATVPGWYWCVKCH